MKWKRDSEYGFATKDVSDLIPPGASFVVAEPFIYGYPVAPERYGRYWGATVDALTAIRELENLLERSVALSNTNIILPESLALSIHKRRWIEGIKDRRFDIDEVVNGVSLEAILEEIERAYIKKALDCNNGNKHKAAALLGLSLRSLRYRIEKLGIEK